MPRQLRGKETPCRDEGELDQGEGDGFGKGIENGFGGRVSEGGAEIPDEAEDLERWSTTMLIVELCRGKPTTSR